MIAALDLGQFAPIFPQQIAGPPIQRLHHIPRIRQEQYGVVRQRRFFLITRLHIPGPGEAKTADIARVDLVESAEAPAGKIATARQPIVRRWFREHGVADRREQVQKIVTGTRRRLSGGKNKGDRYADGHAQECTRMEFLS